MGVGLTWFSVKEEKEYSRANTIASEALSFIRTVFAFSGQENELDRYSKNLGAAARVSLKKSIIIGFGKQNFYDLTTNMNVLIKQTHSAPQSVQLIMLPFTTLDFTNGPKCIFI